MANRKPIVALGGAFAVTALAIATTFIGAHEGLSLAAYQDYGKRWTICYGSANGIMQGQRMTRAQCEELLSEEVSSYMGKIIVLNDKKLPPEVLAAHTSLAYNIGLHAYAFSKVLRDTNEGKYEEGCKSFMNWRYIGKKDCSDPKNKCMGIYTRRKDEEALCLKGWKTLK